jgi:glycosyltransferase involved in cell wall biosynthesis
MDSVSEHVHERLGVPLSRVHTVRNSLPALSQPRSGRFELRESLSVPQGAFCVLFVGRLRIQKSVDTLLRAINELKGIIPNLLVLIVGEGKGYEEDNLKSLCTQLELDDVVQFRGVTKQPDHYMDMADIFVLPSVFEGLPLVMLEAFRSSLPVVATDINGPKEVVVDGENGLLFQPKDYHALAEIIQLLFEDLKLRSKLGVAGHETYLDEFTIKKYADKIEKLYMA